jgi:NADPH-dependent curcumin reductase CurA
MNRFHYRSGFAAICLVVFFFYSSSALSSPDSAMKAQRCLLKAYPDGPLSADHFEFDCQEIHAGEDLLEEGQILVELLHISVDPYMRTRFKPGPGYIVAGFEIGKPIDSACVAKVVQSRNADFEVGSLVAGLLPWETVQVVPNPTSLNKLPKLEGVPPSYFLGILGLTGLSAYMPFKHFAKDYLAEKKDGGSVVFVSGAAGAVGSVFGQLCKARLDGCKVYGSAGTQEKIDLCKNGFGFDDAFNYKDGIAKGLDSILQGQTIDVYFDNVGGEMLDEVLLRMSKGGKIICCGSISDYDKKDEEKYAIKNYFQITAKCLTMHGFLLGQFADEIMPASQELGAMLAEKKLIPHETVLQGFDKVVEGLLGLFQGTNTGKMVISV